MARTTIATARKLARKYATDFVTEVDSDTITVWFDLDSIEAATEAVARIMQCLPGCTMISNGSKSMVYYRLERQPADLGDWCDPSARWHY